jgi:hypothetical protein
MSDRTGGPQAIEGDSWPHGIKVGTREVKDRGTVRHVAHCDPAAPGGLKNLAEARQLLG